MATVRRTKWHPPPPPTPRILHLPRRSNRRKNPTRNTRKSSVVPAKGKLERLFEEERSFAYSIPPVVLLNSGIGERGRREITEEEAAAEEQWRFQAEMLRAECNFLRMEREIAVKKLKTERGLLQSSLKSAVHTLLSGKKKIREGKSVNLEPIEEEIEELAKKLVELQRSSKVKHSRHNSSSSSSSNFDKQAFLLRKELEKVGEMDNGDSAKETGEISRSSFSSEIERDGRFEGFGLTSRRKSNRFADVETLRRKMEGLSKGKLLKRMEEEYGSMLAPSANSSMPNSASTSKRYDLPELSSFSIRLLSQEAKSGEPKTCSGHCKTIVRRIMEQVRAETEQWSQMQEMLGQVREEMEELQVSRDFWEKRALESSSKIDTLNSEVGEWKQKAHSLESNENQLQEQVRELQQALEKIKIERSKSDSEVNKARKDLVPISLGAQLAKEKRALTYREKGSGLTSENRDMKTVDHGDDKKTPQKNGSKCLSSSRHPFKDIGNISPLVRQNSRRSVHPLHSPQDS